MGHLEEVTSGADQVSFCTVWYLAIPRHWTPALSHARFNSLQKIRVNNRSLTLLMKADFSWQAKLLIPPAMVAAFVYACSTFYWKITAFLINLYGMWEGCMSDGQIIHNVKSSLHHAKREHCSWTQKEWNESTVWAQSSRAVRKGKGNHFSITPINKR